MITGSWFSGPGRAAALVVLSLLAALEARPQDRFPDRPIRLIVPYESGGTAAITANVISEGVRQNTGKAVVVEYRPGAFGNIGVDAVLKAPADGYTIGWTAFNSFAINPHLFKKLPYDVHNDVQPITTIGTVPNLVVVNPEVKVRNLQDLIALSKTTDVTYAVSAVGSSIHLSAEMLMSASGFKMRVVPYKGETPAVRDVLGGRVPVMMASITGLLSYVHSGKLRAIAVTSGKRTGVLPDVPTVGESGVPGFDVQGIFILFTARGVQGRALDWLHRELSRAVDGKEVRETLGRFGIDARSSSISEVQALIKAEYERWGPVIKRLGLSLD